MRRIDIRKLVTRKLNKEEARQGRRTYPKPGRLYYFSRFGDYLGSRAAAAPFLPSSPVVNGVRMRYEKGKLVPRVSG